MHSKAQFLAGTQILHHRPDLGHQISWGDRIRLMGTVVASDFAVVLVLLKDIPPGSWVALSPDNRLMLAWGADMRGVLLEARRAGESDPIMLRVPR